MLLDIILKELNDEANLFNFGHRQASKFLHKAVQKVSATCIPNNKKPTWKDYRSSMACHLLKIGWTTDEIKKRMRHSPSSKVLDRYVNYLALDRNKPKEKVSTHKMTQFSDSLKESKQREVFLNRKLVNQGNGFQELKEEFEDMKDGKGFLRLLLKFITKR